MIKFFLKYKVQIYCIIVITLFTSCEVDEDPITIDEQEGKARIELFTRAYSYNIPSLRSSANEGGLNKTPWIIVFKKNASNNFIFEEAVQTIEFTGIDKRYVDLKTQTQDCKVMILANTQSTFYIKGDNTAHVFSEANLNSLFSGKKLEEVSSTLYSQPLNNPQTTIPFSNNDLLPMSYVVDLNGGINNNTTIGLPGNPLQLKRIVAKVILKNADPNFIFKGVTTVVNAPKESLLHLLSGGEPANNDNQNLIEYRVNDNYTTEIAPAISETTASNPIYLYESKSGTTKDTYFIIKGEYDGTDYYYKMRLVDSDKELLDVSRNYLYTYTITNILGRGYNTVEDAKKSDTNFESTITVTDDYSYEIIANDDYYLSLTNSVFITYTDATRTYTISSLATDCNIDFNNRPISISNDYGGHFSLIGSDQIPIVISGVTSDPVTRDLEVTISNSLDHPWGGILLEIGNLKKRISIKKNEAVSANGGYLEIGAPHSNSEQNKYPYYYTSGYVVEETAKSWIKLVSSAGVIRDDSSSIVVDDGIIKVYIEPNTTNSIRRGTLFLAALDAYKEEENWFRIKLDVTQKAN